MNNNSEDSRIIIGAIVNNQYGVLMRICELFAKRCYNIESLEVGVTDNPELSRMTIVASGDEYARKQIVKQLAKLHDVRKVAAIPTERACVREHMLIKLQVVANSQTQLTAMINEFGGKVVDFSPHTITAEVTGEVASNDAFVQAAQEYGILEVCRAGAQALHRGSECLQNSTE